MESIVIYHNPKCSKSRAALDFLNQQECNIEICEYANPAAFCFSVEGIKQLTTQLEFSSVREMMRKKEPIYQALNLDDEALPESMLIQALIENPLLLERPILIKNGKAKIARSPESLVEFVEINAFLSF